jgi:DNA-binding XRE family transcriptional regulator
MKLTNHLKQHRARLNFTQQDLAEKAGVRRQTVLAIEKGQYAPSAILAFRLAGALGMKVDELFELTGEDEEGPR